MALAVDISRREAVRRLTVLVGGALSSSTVSALLAGCEAPGSAATPEWFPEVLTGGQMDRLTVVVDAILPSTDTPGAVDVGVPQLIDHLLADWAERDEVERVLGGLDGLDGLTEERVGAAFLEADPDEQVRLVESLDRETAQAREDESEPLPYFALIKEWTITGYYTSEAGATQELQWVALPGRYDADVPLSEVGRTWA